MRNRIWTLALALPLAAAAGAAGAQELRVGFIGTISGGGAIVGQSVLNGFQLGLTDEGWTKDGDKLGGVPTKLFIEDARQQPDVARLAIRKLISSEKVHVVTGTAFSNIALAIARPAIRSKTIFLSGNAGPSPLAGPQCSPYFTAISFQNDQWGESLGKLMVDDGMKTVFTIAPNYQAGKDMISGFRRFYKGGKEIGTILFKLGQTDFQADLSRIAAARPQAVSLFAPGAMGIAFMKQWQASGVGKNIKIYTIAAVDGLTIKPIGAAAEGSIHTSNWSGDLPNELNQRFVKAYVARFKLPPPFYAAQGYDAARLLAATVRKIGGKVDDRLAFAHALRRTPFPTVRGSITFDVNGMPIQKWYKQDVVVADGKASIKTAGVVIDGARDSYWQKCPKAQRY